MIVYACDRKKHRALTLRKQTLFHLPSACLRAALFAMIWWILTDGALNSWLVGVPVVLFATLLSMALHPPFSWSLPGALRFIPFFLWRSLCGAVDVAIRALHPRLPLSSRLFDHPWHLPPGLPRVFMANITSLLPGTLSVELGENHLQVHVLNRQRDISSELDEIEQRVAAIFAISLNGG